MVILLVILQAMLASAVFLSESDDNQSDISLDYNRHSCNKPNISSGILQLFGV
jgi:hypothetical protein